MKSPEQIVEHDKIMATVRDLLLTVDERLDLMWRIPVRQQERWERMKSFHNIAGITNVTRHFFMSREIALMREQRARLERLKQFL
jgi:hypothetical protein